MLRIEYFDKERFMLQLSASHGSVLLHLDNGKTCDLKKDTTAQTIVFEDSLYALKTAKAAGFYTVGVYDADGESDQAGLKAAADLYVKELGEAAGRW